MTDFEHLDVDERRNNSENACRTRGVFYYARKEQNSNQTSWGNNTRTEKKDNSPKQGGQSNT